jgi:hypothetical protein
MWYGKKKYYIELKGGQEYLIYYKKEEGCLD